MKLELPSACCESMWGSGCMAPRFLTLPLYGGEWSASCCSVLKLQGELGGILLIIKPKRCTISQIYFAKVLYMFRTDLLSIMRSLNTVYAAIGICHGSSVDCPLLADSMTNTYCCIYSVETPDDGQQICLKHIEFFIKINLRNSASCWLYHKNI